MAARKLTVSLIKAEIGEDPSDGAVHLDLVKRAEESLEKAKGKGLILDYRVVRYEDGLRLLMTHRRATSDEKVRKLAWETFLACTETAKRLRLNGVMSFTRCETQSIPDGRIPATGQPGGAGGTP